MILLSISNNFWHLLRPENTSLISSKRTYIMEKVFVTFLIKFADINIMYWLLDIITVCSWHGMSWDDDMTSHQIEYQTND